MAAATLGQPGWWVGELGKPVTYRLRSLVHGAGLEGEVWAADSAIDGVPQRWAVKVLSAERILAAERTPSGRSARTVLTDWERRWRESLRRVQNLRPSESIVLPAEVFPGSPPQRAPGAATPPGRLLYLVSRWVDGGLTLWSWCHAGPDLAQRCDVLDQLCRAVAWLAAAGVVHGDLSPANVMLEDGRVRLIDFSFMAHAGAAPVPRLGTRGYAAPELPTRAPVDPATDRYAVGALAYVLLIGDHPPDTPWQLRRQLRAEFGDSLADHVAALLHPDPRARPADLIEWCAGVRRLVGHGAGADRGHRDVAVAVDGFQTTEIVAVGTARVTVAVAGSRLTPLLETLPDPAPEAVEAVALARRGNGDLAMVTRDTFGALALRVDGMWRREDGLRATGPVRAAGHGDGRVSGFAVDVDGRLVQLTVGLDGRVTRTLRTADCRRVLAAASGLGGEVFLAVEDRGGRVRCGPPDALRRSTLSTVEAVALCVNAKDQPVCVAARPGSAELQKITCPEDDVSSVDETIPGKPDVRDVAALWLRTGLLLAIATRSGLWVAPRIGEWVCLWPHPVTRVALAVGYSWRVQVVALADGRVIHAEESGVDRWFRAKPLEPAG